MFVVIGNQIRVLSFLLVIFNHRLDIRQHVLSLPVTSIFLLALLNGWHACTIIFDDSVARSMVLFIAFCRGTHAIDVLEVLTIESWIILHLPLLAILIKLIIKVIIAAVIPLLLSPALNSSALLVLLIPTIFESLNLSLQFTEMLLQILIHFPHLKILLLVILSCSFLGLQFFL